MCYESEVLNIHLLSKEKPSVMLWYNVYHYSFANWSLKSGSAHCEYKILIMTESI